MYSYELMRMQSKILISLVFISLILISLISISYSQRPYRMFTIVLPELVEVYPGEAVTVNGGVLNNGWWWLRNFSLTVNGLLFPYEIQPSHWDELRIIREWNPQQGIYKVPENFTLTIGIPDNAVGVYIVNVTGQEFQSFYQVSNSSLFILKILPVPKFSISDIIIPDSVTEYKAFKISMSVKNEGFKEAPANVSITIPSDWNVDKKSQYLRVGANSSIPIEFFITPTNTSGQISVQLEYPYKQTIVNITKSGPYLIPMPLEVIVAPKTKLEIIVDFIKGLSSWVIGILVVAFVVLIWYFYNIIKKLGGRKEPEEMKKKQVDTAPADITEL